MLKMFCPESHQLLVIVLKLAVFGCFNTDTTLLLILAQGVTGNRDDIRLGEKCWDCALPIPPPMVRSPKKCSPMESRDWSAPFVPSGLETPTPRLGHSADLGLGFKQGLSFLLQIPILPSGSDWPQLQAAFPDTQAHTREARASWMCKEGPSLVTSNKEKVAEVSVPF